MKLNWSSVRWGKSHFTKNERTVAVCSDEKESVESVKMTPAQAMAGHQARSQAGSNNLCRRGCISGNCGARRGLRQGCESDKFRSPVTFFSLAYRLLTSREEFVAGKTSQLPERREQSYRTPCLFHAIVRGFAGDDHVVYVAFAEACGGDADEAGFFREFAQSWGADVAHATLEAADKLISQRA